MLFISKLDGKLSCSEHDPCGPDPLEPGEIREYMPNMTSMRPGAMTAPVTLSLGQDSRGATSAPITPPAGEAVLARQGPPPRLYINTKTSTSSFIPSSRSYHTDRTEGKGFSTPTSSKDEREDGEVEDGEVCGLDMEEVEDDDDDDDEEAEDDEDDMEEMEIVEDEEEIVEEEEEEPLYGGDLLEEGDEEDEEEDGGDVYDTYSDYVDEDDDGEVEGEDLEECGRVEDDDK